MGSFLCSNVFCEFFAARVVVPSFTAAVCAASVVPVCARVVCVCVVCTAVGACGYVCLLVRVRVRAVCVRSYASCPVLRDLCVSVLCMCVRVRECSREVGCGGGGGGQNASKYQVFRFFRPAVGWSIPPPVLRGPSTG